MGRRFANLDFKSLITGYINPYFSLPFRYFSDAYFTEVSDDEVPLAGLVRSFGAAPFDPGDHEVYAREDYPRGRFDDALFQRFAAFAQAVPGLQRIRHAELTSTFFVICDEQPVIWRDADVEITDVLEVTFDWEQL
jgi:hypothetical protein